MLKNHCDGCDKIVDRDKGGYWVIEVSRCKRDVKRDHDNGKYPEKSRELCDGCMAKVRSGLNVVDGLA